MIKRKNIFVMFVVLLMVFAVSCSSQKEDEKSEKKQEEKKEEKQEVNQTLIYSNLVDEESQKLLKDAFKNAGFSEDKINKFLEDVNAFNSTVGEVGLVEKGFKEQDSLKTVYDEVKMMEALEQNYPKVLWHNCRLTTFRLFGDFIDIKNPEIADTTMLFQDKETIEQDKNIIGERNDDFMSLFSYIKTKNTDDVNEHIKVLTEDWKKKGIEFKNDKVSFVSVVFNTNIEETDETSQLFIGHAGLLWEGEEGKLFFLEKLSFMEPYQLLKFNNRQDLSDYLMNKYDIDIGQKISIPFVMENDHLIEGYRPNMNKKIEE